jgi:GAF domain-containing protein
MLVQHMLSRLKAQPDLPATLHAAVSEVVGLHGAEFGNIQLYGEDGYLWMVGHNGLPVSFIKAAARISPAAGTVCARAWRARKMVVVADVKKDRAFRPFMELARQAGFRSVLSQPLISSRDECIGVVSAHFATVREPSEIEVTALGEFCRQATDHLLSKAPARELARAAWRMHWQVCGADVAMLP